jgi:hypothetical protein
MTWRAESLAPGRIAKEAPVHPRSALVEPSFSEQMKATQALSTARTNTCGSVVLKLMAFSEKILSPDFATLSIATMADDRLIWKLDFSPL